ncbi:MAG: SlyX family protein [Proteobacteria bacterium]|nr:SlyX family protein [Pseudomonadota bacterium]
MTEQRLENLETKLAFQEDLIQKLDDALGSQQQQLLEIRHQLELLIEQIKLMENSIPELPDSPPPHF